MIPKEWAIVYLLKLWIWSEKAKGGKGPEIAIMVIWQHTIHQNCPLRNKDIFFILTFLRYSLASST